MKKEVLLTFDYELFLGSNSGTVENCLIKPTNKIIPILEKYNLKSIFFIDLTYLCRLYSIKDLHEKPLNDWLLIQNQIMTHS